MTVENISGHLFYNTETCFRVFPFLLFILTKGADYYQVFV